MAKREGTFHFCSGCSLQLSASGGWCGVWFPPWPSGSVLQKGGSSCHLSDRAETHSGTFRGFTCPLRSGGCLAFSPPRVSILPSPLKTSSSCRPPVMAGPVSSPGFVSSPMSSFCPHSPGIDHLLSRLPKSFISCIPNRENPRSLGFGSRVGHYRMGGYYDMVFLSFPRIYAVSVVPILCVHFMGCEGCRKTRHGCCS